MSWWWPRIFRIPFSSQMWSISQSLNGESSPFIRSSKVSNEDMPVRSPSHRPMLPNAISGLPPIGFLYEESADWDPLKKSRRAPVSIL